MIKLILISLLIPMISSLFGQVVRPEDFSGTNEIGDTLGNIYTLQSSSTYYVIVKKDKLGQLTRDTFFKSSTPTPGYKYSADRYYSSPCFALLGYNPFMDAEQQEKNYRECEESKKSQTGNKIIIGSGVVLCIGLMVWVFTRKKKTESV